MRRNQRFNTPHIAVLVATGIPILVILRPKRIWRSPVTYAFGLLGAFVFVGRLDTIRWRLDAAIGFWLGVFTTAS
jgi:hypothetical protein